MKPFLFASMLLLTPSLFAQETHDSETQKKIQRDTETVVPSDIARYLKRLNDINLSDEKRVESLEKIPKDYFAQNPDLVNQLIQLYLKEFLGSNLKLSNALKNFIAKLKINGYLVGLKSVLKLINPADLSREFADKVEKDRLQALLSILTGANGTDLDSIPELFFQQNKLGSNLYSFLGENILGAKDSDIKKALGNILRNTHSDSSNTNKDRRSNASNYVHDLLGGKRSKELAANPNVSEFIDLFFNSLNLNSEFSKFQPYLDSKKFSILLKASEVLDSHFRNRTEDQVIPDSMLTAYRTHLKVILKEKDSPTREWELSSTDKLSEYLRSYYVEKISYDGLKTLANYYIDKESFSLLVEAIPLHTPRPLVDDEKMDINYSESQANFEYRSSKCLNFLAYFSDKGKDAISTKSFLKNYKEMEPKKQLELVNKVSRILTMSANPENRRKAAQTLGLIIESHLPKTLDLRDLATNKDLFEADYYNNLVNYLKNKNNEDKNLRLEVQTFDEQIATLSESQKSSDEFKNKSARIETLRARTNVNESELIKMEIINAINPEFYTKSLIPSSTPASQYSGNPWLALGAGLALTVTGPFSTHLMSSSERTNTKEDPNIPSLLTLEQSNSLSNKVSKILQTYDSKENVLTKN